ncbi:Codeine 3-O-demethylase [Handroanthus impetiginosus]|uniref:Codeine 3-O-demethylase n=1 Tax=Handroanthus impetiginosus TaxID=429701 RepID=A0A2G9H8N3_9LAMI|nr:Codeine 3-O-demethylase [Handroanthus impetiginosus]
MVIIKVLSAEQTINSVKERLSIATFLNPKLEGDFGPPLSLVSPKSPAKFKRIVVVDFVKGHFSRELKGKSYVEAAKI